MVALRGAHASALTLANGAALEFTLNGSGQPLYTSPVIALNGSASASLSWTFRYINAGTNRHQ